MSTKAGHVIAMSSLVTLQFSFFLVHLTAAHRQLPEHVTIAFPINCNHASDINSAVANSHERRIVIPCAGENNYFLNFLLIFQIMVIPVNPLNE